MSKFHDRVEQYCADRQRSGHWTSVETVRTNRFFLDRLGDHITNRDPSLVSHLEIEDVLAQWSNPNTYSQARTAFNGFYKWLRRRGFAKSNPIDRIEAPRKRPARKVRLTMSEMQAMMDACRNTRERRAVYLMACAGLRNRELRLLRGRHFTRPGFIWISEDIAKGGQGRERWIPVSRDLAPIVAEILRTVDHDELVLPSLRSFDPGVNEDLRPTRAVMSSDGLAALIDAIAKRAGITPRVTPHALRHYCGQTITASAGIYNAKAILGHVSIQTTQIYAGEPSLDDLARMIGDVEFRLSTPNRALRAVDSRTRLSSSLSDSVDLRAFGALLVSLKRSLRPVARELAA